MSNDKTQTTTCQRCGTKVLGDNLHTCTPKTTPEEFMAKQMADPETKAVYERLAKR